MDNFSKQIKVNLSRYKKEKKKSLSEIILEAGNACTFEITNNLNCVDGLFSIVVDLCANKECRQTHGGYSVERNLVKIKRLNRGHSNNT